ncbi:MAG TPA: N-acetylmuramoyl-L-alanine amidase [Spirochaetota bacterium]|mgnify:CR=1 FL=1|nr:N-acetylmuramoyl-L-alanine amidase [Spirochaetota bacterium]HPJ35341.1 N-acetylmuramoyl-L-alanine amidase [Spirochaetota bacterium]
MKKRISLSILILLIFSSSELFSKTEIKKNQTGIIKNVLRKADIKNQSEAAEIINYVDDVYGSLYKRLKNNGKLTIYFGPAHGKDNTGEWRGITTERIGVTGLPEEWYSIIYSRKLYNLLKQNKFIEISAAPYYMDVLEGRTDSYHYMKFRNVTENAYNSDAFMIIEMHMNNVSVFQKADGLINMPGIHMIRDCSGRRMLKNIKGSYSGFLTLYNKFDASGFSKKYALNIKKSLEAKGYKANGWEYGAVGDDRFTYYLLFPVSVIYECGFISHPREEEKLRDPYYMDGMVNSHYRMLLKTIHDIYGIDISGNILKGNPKNVRARIELLKLARLTILFMKKGDVSGAVTAVNAMKKYYKNSGTRSTINYYDKIIKRVKKGERYYKKGLAYKKKRKYRKARTYFVRAKRSLDKNIMYSAIKKKYNAALYGNRSSRKKSITSSKKKSPKTVSTRKAIYAAPSRITKPFILSLSSKEELEHALAESLGADDRNIKLISESMKNYKKTYWKKVRKYSKKRKRRIWVWRKKTKDFKFTPGIYIVNLDKKLGVVKAKRVSAVYLDPHKYQNQQYLKNSYFAETIRKKEI